VKQLLVISLGDPCGRQRKRLFLGGIAITTLALLTLQTPRSLATCPPNCGLGFTVNTTFDAATGAGDASPGNGICETAPGNGVCTLRAAIEEANAYSSAHGGVSDGIGFDLSTSDPNFNGIFWTINLSTALPNLSTDIDISGPGAGKLTVKPNTSLNFRLFNITATGTVTLSGMTITKATPTGGDGGGIFNGGGGTVNLSNCVISASSGKHGGGISNSFGATVNLTNCTLSGNNAWGGGGGGIDNGGTVNLTNCTISGNSAPINGGGIRNGGTLNLTNCTISGNTATLGTHDNGGGISNEGSTANVTNCTITGNTASNLGGGIYSTTSTFTTTNVKSSIIALNTAGTGPDVDGPFVAQGFNLIGKNDGAAASFPAGIPNMNNDIVGTSGSPVDPKLDPNGLQNNGGSTLTIALLAGSPAIDKGTSVGSTGNLTSDQRGPGYTRTVNNPSAANAAGGDGTDIGAFEFGVTITLISIARSGADIVVTFQAVQGATYRLERKLAVTDSTWESISGVNDFSPSSSGPAPITHAGGANLTEAFYRVRLL
jgi:CSLREA domain-containing protein